MTLQQHNISPCSAWRPSRARRSFGRWCLGLIVFALTICANLAPRAEEAPFSEYQVKSAWLLNFARFVEWPPTGFPNAKAPFVVGVVGRGPFGKELEQAFAGKIVKGRAFEVRRLASDSDLRGCHILFFMSSEKRRLRDSFEKLSGFPVLTVGESDEFLDQGGIINFLLKDKSVRFEINLKAAQAAGLKLDANLLKVAVAVRGKYE
jgi:hypothetical protein